VFPRGAAQRTLSEIRAEIVLVLVCVLSHRATRCARTNVIAIGDL
jgi:hypothetical protein